MPRRDIVINGRFLTRRVTGVERYGREVLSFIGDKCQVARPARALNGAEGHAWEQFILPRKLDSKSILWSAANTGPLLVRDQALTIHDLSPLEHPEWFKGTFSAWYRLFLPILAKRVRLIFTPSEYIRRKAAARFGIKDVIVTPNGVNPSIFHPNAKQRERQLPECYILFVGTLEPRKNLGALLRAWNDIKDDFRETWLVIAGAHGRVFRPVQLAYTVERVHFLGYVDDDALPGLYANAILFVLPSLDEGFGLSALEAMACGTPVIASNAGALPETVGDAGLLFEPLRPDTLVAQMIRYLSDPDLRLLLKEKGLARANSFSWQRTAEIIWSTLNEI